MTDRRIVFNFERVVDAWNVALKLHVNNRSNHADNNAVLYAARVLVKEGFLESRTRGLFF